MSKFSYVSTGFTSGLGGIAKPYVESALAGWHHIMICRNPERFSENENRTIIKCDLSSIKSVKQATQKIANLVERGKVPPLKYIFNNAGVSYINRTTTSVDGYENTFHVNVIAVYFLLDGLIPLLKNQSGSRVFITGSNVHYGDKEHNHGMVPKPYWNDVNLDEVVLPVKNPADENPKSITAGGRAYSTSKLAVIYLIYKLAKENKDIKFIVYEPGFVPGTGLGRDAGAAMAILMKPFGLIFRLIGWATTPKIAGRNLGKNMVSDELFAKVNNVIYCDIGEITKSSEESYNEKREDQLWAYLTKLNV